MVLKQRLIYFLSVPSCGPPTLPRNSELRREVMKSSYKYSEKVFLKCKSGYFSAGMGILNCGLEGWTETSFTCSRMSKANFVKRV